MVALWILYVCVGVIGVVARSPSPDPLHQVDPYLAILEILLTLCVVALVVMMSAVYSYAPADRKTHGMAALACTIIFAAITACTSPLGLGNGQQTCGLRGCRGIDQVKRRKIILQVEGVVG